MVRFDTDCYNVNESDGTVTLRVVLNNPVSTRLTYFLTFSDGSATAPSDYINPGDSAQVTIQAGQTQATFTVTLNNDNIHELIENFTVLLVAPAEGNPADVTLGSPNPTTVKIIDDDGECVSHWYVCLIDLSSVATVQFSQPRYTVAENDGMAVLDVVLSRPSAVPVTIFFTTVPGTALVTNDFVARTGQITIPPMTTTLPVTVTIVNDNIPEPTEEFQGRLALLPGTTAPGIMLGPIEITTVEITDSDGE